METNKNGHPIEKHTEQLAKVPTDGELTNEQNYKICEDIPEPLLEQYLSQKEIAIDTELHGLELFRDQVCLVQICDRQKRACLISPQPGSLPPNLKHLLTYAGVMKVFHYAMGDVTFLKVSNGVDVHPFRCTKIMSKLVRTYARSHSLEALIREVIGKTVDKSNQSSDWGKKNLSSDQLQYAVKDVLYLLEIYDVLLDMMKRRKNYATGCPVQELNERCQAFLPSMVALVINGFTAPEDRFKVNLYEH